MSSLNLSRRARHSGLSWLICKSLWPVAGDVNASSMSVTSIPRCGTAKKRIPRVACGTLDSVCTQEMRNCVVNKKAVRGHERESETHLLKYDATKAMRYEDERSVRILLLRTIRLG